MFNVSGTIYTGCGVCQVGKDHPLHDQFEKASSFSFTGNCQNISSKCWVLDVVFDPCFGYGDFDET